MVNLGLANVKLIASLASSQETDSNKGTKRNRSPPRPSQQPIDFKDSSTSQSSLPSCHRGLSMRNFHFSRLILVIMTHNL